MDKKNLQNIVAEESPVQRYAACVEYDGANYCGWQRQIHSPSVQEQVEKALSKVADHEIKVICAGRTDTGVHATGQIIHFESANSRTEFNWVSGANSQLPTDICIRWAKPVPEEFHARFSAVARTYRYLLLCNKQRTAISPQAITLVRVDDLDIAKMQQAMDRLIGKHDFSAFRGANCQAKSPIRQVEFVNIDKIGQVIQFEIRANAFLLHMVRNLVGALIPVGKRELSVADFEVIFRGLDRKLAPSAAAPNGLYLTEVEYPPEFKLPEPDNALWLRP